jgi:lipoate-protein ligase A
MLPKQEFDRTFALEKIRLALHQLDIPAMLNSRHDLCVEEKKISGSAFKLTSSRAYHHGTMLIDTDLNLLLKYLTPKSIDIQGLGTDSVRSTVTKLRDYSYTIDHSSFCESVGLEFQKQFGKTETVFVDSSFVNDTIRDIAASLQTREWIYGQTPRYSLKLSKDFGFGLIDIELVVEKGIVTKATVSSPNQPFSKRLEKALENQKMYGILVKDKFSDLGFIFDWLSQEVST